MARALLMVVIFSMIVACNLEPAIPTPPSTSTGEGERIVEPVIPAAQVFIDEANLIKILSGYWLDDRELASPLPANGAIVLKEIWSSENVNAPPDHDSCGTGATDNDRRNSFTQYFYHFHPEKPLYIEGIITCDHRFSTILKDSDVTVKKWWVNNNNRFCHKTLSSDNTAYCSNYLLIDTIGTTVEPSTIQTIAFTEQNGVKELRQVDSAIQNLHNEGKTTENVLSRYPQ